MLFSKEQKIVLTTNVFFNNGRHISFVRSCVRGRSEESKIRSVLELKPRKREPCPGGSVKQLELKQPKDQSAPIDLVVSLSGDNTRTKSLLCADPRHQCRVLDRILHVCAGRNHQANALDKFFRALGLPGILK